jgi:uracil-DNA glycosylase family 4
MSELQPEQTDHHLKVLQTSHSSCTDCPLYKDATQGVPGVGSMNPKVLILGEAPGREEDLGGRPFIGRAGQLLQDILCDLEVTIDQIYVTNVVKHRPPGNRNPTAEEITACAEHALVAEIDMVNPEMIICVGRVPTQALAQIAGHTLPSGSLRGYTFSYEGIPVHSTWHPAFILRRQDKRQELVDDLAEAFA